MELCTAGQISKDYNISTRMLRYYEQMGLIGSSRSEDYAYRMYDGDAVKRLQQIIILRKLQIPVKQIREILDNTDALSVIEVFKQNISEIDEQITALSTVKSILSRFVEEMRQKADIQLKLDLLKDTSILSVVSSLSFSDNKIKEKVSMDELNKAVEQLPKRTDVRIVYLPPATVAAVQSTEGVPEWDAFDKLAEFAKKVDLLKIKPDARSFGYNCMIDGRDGYEAWATIPEDMEVPAPFVKKTVPGGLYACHSRAFSQLNNDENSTLRKWIGSSEIFEHDKRDTVGMYGHLEEQFVFETYMFDGLKRFDYMHIDFFMPVKRKK